ncbi:glycosyl transferase family 1 [Thermanaerothrix daxensis]|uniref:Glycosyl transferase family 1 n=1 Tax=Thermanaerothrix daxensis TaxID=869279 RepID=A0A0N8GQ57_9CHLR|nr:glycosyltransferase family 4 protein [Thermanaerothrix daxensis]KPL82770.1 glycosyl transferase family 1 [Thermanaerothrix daxensis]
MRILTVLTYYRPHTSGLTIYAERLAKALARRGHQVTVLTSQYERSLPREEQVDGVRIVRAPVMWRVSKGVIMPTFGFLATRLVLSHDVVHLHLPQFDAAGIALRGRLLRKPTVITYHCDLRMPPGLVAWLANQAVLVMNELAALFTHRIVTYTQDYADHSAYLRRYMHKLHVIPPPVELPVVTLQSIQEFGKRFNPEGRRPVIGMAARFATEKGVEVLLDALPRILEVYPQAQVHFAGPYQNIVGEEQYFRRLAPRIEALQAQGHWRFLGVLNPEDMARFYPNIDVLVLPSLNSTEAFGLVQIEAMMNDVPCVASDLPGVRQPVLRHHMGHIAPVGDSHALAEAILEVLANREQFKVDRETIRQQYHPDAIAAHFETLFQTMWDELH